MLVWHTILYRKNNVKFYLDYSVSDLKTQIGRFIYDPGNEANSYPEYDGLNVEFYSSGSQKGKIYTNIVKSEGGKVRKLINFTYYLTNDFTLSTANATAADIEHIKKPAGKPSLTQFRDSNFQPTKDHDFDMEYIKGTAGERTFAIDDIEAEVEVYNTSQLFMVAQYGAKPKFADGDSVVKTVYGNAKTVLTQINNSDDLTEYEKALNIYNYIVQNVNYDHVLFDYMDVIGDDSVFSFGNFGVFHLEGVLYDLTDQVAVCDGLSKAYALMCNIEGIYATKVNGLAGPAGNRGKHAWNEVKIGDEFHWVDTTWGMSYWHDNGANILYEYSTRSYFLVKKDNQHIPEFTVGNNTITDYNYFGKLTVEHNSEDITHLVNSAEQLSKLMEYYESLCSAEEKNIAFEVKLTNTGYLDVQSEGLNTIISGADYVLNDIASGRFLSIFIEYV